MARSKRPYLRIVVALAPVVIAAGLCAAAYFAWDSHEKAKVRALIADLASGDAVRQDQAEDALGQLRRPRDIAVLVNWLGEPASEKLYDEVTLIFAAIGRPAAGPVLKAANVVVTQQTRRVSPSFPRAVNELLAWRDEEEHDHLLRMRKGLRAAIEGMRGEAYDTLNAMLPGFGGDQHLSPELIALQDSILITNLRSWDEATRLSAVMRLGMRCLSGDVKPFAVGDRATLEKMISMLQWEGAGTIEAGYVLAQADDAELVDLLRPCLEWTDPVARRRAVVALARRADSSVLPEMLADARSESRSSGQSLWLLSCYDDAEAVGALVEAAMSDVDVRRRGALYGLANLATRETATAANRELARGTLRKLLDEGDDALKLEAATAFTQYGMDDADEFHRSDLTNADWKRRQRAASILAHKGNRPEAVAVIMADLEDKNAEARESAARTLAWCAGPEAIEPLRQALRDGEASVVGAAKDALLQIKLREARRTREASAGGN